MIQPRLSFRREDLSLLFERGGVFVTSGGRSPEKLAMGSAREVVACLAQSTTWKRWLSIRRQPKWPVVTLRRIVLDILQAFLDGKGAGPALLEARRVPRSRRNPLGLV